MTGVCKSCSYIVQSFIDHDDECPVGLKAKIVDLETRLRKSDVSFAETIISYYPLIDALEKAGCGKQGENSFSDMVMEAIVRISTLQTQLSEQSTTVQRDWLSPVEAHGIRLRIAVLETQLSERSDAKMVESGWLSPVQADGLRNRLSTLNTRNDELVSMADHVHLRVQVHLDDYQIKLTNLYAKFQGALEAYTKKEADFQSALRRIQTLQLYVDEIGLERDTLKIMVKGLESELKASLQNDRELMDQAQYTIANRNASLALRTSEVSARDALILELTGKVSTLQFKLDNLPYRADFLWPHEDGSKESLGYEFANARNEGYRQEVWNELVETIESNNTQALTPQGGRKTQEEIIQAMADKDALIKTLESLNLRFLTALKKIAEIAKGWKESYLTPPAPYCLGDIARAALLVSLDNKSDTPASPTNPDVLI